MMRPILNYTLYLTGSQWSFFQLGGNVSEFRGTGDNPALIYLGLTGLSMHYIGNITQWKVGGIEESTACYLVNILF